MNFKAHRQSTRHLSVLVLLITASFFGFKAVAQTLQVSATGPTTITMQVANVYSWEVQQKNGSAWTRVLTGSAVGAPANFTLERPAGTYTFRLYNCYPTSNGCSTSSNKSVTLVGNTPPAAPSVSAYLSQASITVSWSAPAGATSYRLSRAGRADVTQSTISFNDAAVTPGTTYTYSVIACNAAAQCSPAGTKTIAYPPLPAVPAFSAVVEGPSVRVSWSPVGGLTYELVRGSLVVKPAATPYLDTAVSAGTSYTYVLKACNTASVCSANSKVVTVPPTTL